MLSTRVMAAAMTDIPPTQYFVSDQPEPIQAGNPLWEKRVPMDYRTNKNHQHASLTYGAYFRAISDYTGKIGLARLAKIASHIADRPINLGAISQLDVHLEKHGAFYHPAKLVLHVNSDRIACVVNVAVSPLGKETITEEFDNLKRLFGRYSKKWLPPVYNCQTVAIDSQQDVQMFMGEWFEDFHEFHISTKDAPENPRIRVWDPRNPNLFLSPDQAKQIFEQAAMILTAHYRVDTTEQITSWHHAAGDFVVNLDEKGLAVKLVTVRQYVPLFKLRQPVDNMEGILNTLLIFFLNMAIKMRIDRLDGVGRMAWMSLDIVPGIIKGFFKGLEHQAKNHRIQNELIKAVAIFLARLPEKDIRDLCMDIVDRIEPQSSDLPAVNKGINAHIEAIINGFRQLQLPL